MKCSISMASSRKYSVRVCVEGGVGCVGGRLGRVGWVKGKIL